MRKDTQEILKNISENLRLSVRGDKAFIRDTRMQKDVMQFRGADLADEKAEQPDGRFFFKHYEEECRNAWIEEKIDRDYHLKDKDMMNERVRKPLKETSMDKWPEELARRKDDTEIEYRNMRERYGHDRIPDEISNMMDSLRDLVVIYENLLEDTRDISDFFKGAHPAPMTEQQIRDITVGIIPHEAKTPLKLNFHNLSQPKQQEPLRLKLNNSSQKKPTEPLRLNLKNSTQPKTQEPPINCYEMSFGKNGGFDVLDIDVLKKSPAVCRAIKATLKPDEPFWTKTKGSDDYHAKAVYKGEDGKLKQKDKDICMLAGLYETGTIPGLSLYKLKEGQTVLVNDVKCIYAGGDNVVFAEIQEQTQFRDYYHLTKPQLTPEGFRQLVVQGGYWHTSNGLTNYGDFNPLGIERHSDSDLKKRADHFNRAHSLTAERGITVTFYSLGEQHQEPDQPEKHLLNRYNTVKEERQGKDTAYHRDMGEDISQYDADNEKQEHDELQL